MRTASVLLILLGAAVLLAVFFPARPASSSGGWVFGIGMVALLGAAGLWLLTPKPPRINP